MSDGSEQAGPQTYRKIAFIWDSVVILTLGTALGWVKIALKRVGTAPMPNSAWPVRNWIAVLWEAIVIV